MAVLEVRSVPSRSNLVGSNFQNSGEQGTRPRKINDTLLVFLGVVVFLGLVSAAQRATRQSLLDRVCMGPCQVCMHAHPGMIPRHTAPLDKRPPTVPVHQVWLYSVHKLYIAHLNDPAANEPILERDE